MSEQLWARLPPLDGRGGAGRWHAVRCIPGGRYFGPRYKSSCRAARWWMTPDYAEESHDPPDGERCKRCVSALERGRR